jgi:diguanylate cyclase (GGDEF)-like protein
MNMSLLIQRVRRHFVEMLGLHLKYLAGPQERLRHVRVIAIIGMAVSLAFGVFNMLTPGMQPLAIVEWTAALVFLLPATFLVHWTSRADLAEVLVLLASLVIFGALIFFGGIEGTGLFWVLTAPFLAFFLKGQKQGWWYSLSFVSLVAVYFVWRDSNSDWGYNYSANVRIHFLLSLCFYTLVAANFNLLRARFEERLVQKVVEQTADAAKLRSEMKFLATHDTVTGLPNRALLLERLQQEIALAKTAGYGLVVCNLRLERLFEMSNVLGLHGADGVVRQVAEHLSHIAQERGLLARMRRDEFAIVYRLDQPKFNAESLGKFISKHQIPVQEEGLSLYIELTLGLAIYPDHSTDATLLLKKAEQAMLQARHNVQQWSVYDEQQEEVFMRHHLLFGKLRDALLNHQLVMHYQPQIDLKTGLIVGAEALARWPDPEQGMIAPALFIPIAEESGLIRPLTTWVLGECMRECARWHKLGMAIDISINLSAMNLLDPELPSVLQTALADAELQAHCVNLEITESCFVTSPQRALAVIQTIHKDGFRLSIDDFGTGYSSLSYLKNMPIDELKIDQGFVRNLMQNTSDQAIVSSTIALAHNLKLQVVAEGIEDDLTAQWLTARGCDIGQGYSFAKPMAAKDFIQFAQLCGTQARH